MMSFLLMILLMVVYVVIANSEEVNLESESPYECGFEPTSMARVQFSHRFFLISVLFLIFDIEVVLMLPLPYVMMSVGGLVEFFLFILVLILGLMFEFFFGSLDWL